MENTVDKGKNTVDATGEAKRPLTRQKPLDVVRLSSESTREHPRLLAVTKEAAQARDGYSKGSIYEQQREQQQQQLHQKATGGWYPRDLSNLRPLERLLGGVLIDSEKTTKDFLTSEESTARYEYNYGIKNEKSNISNNLYKTVNKRITGKTPYTEQAIIDYINQIRQSREYLEAFAKSSQQVSDTQTSQTEGESSTQETPQEQETYDDWYKRMGYPR